MSEIPFSEDPSPDSDANAQRRIVRKRYANIATDDGETSCCSDTAGSADACCDETMGVDSERLGYSAADVEAVASGADLGLGCGNPKAIADLDPGETVLDLGSGAGFDCFLAAREVCTEGWVIGVDMTPEMVEKARENVDKNDAANADFRLGEIEHLPVADERVDVVISNCVVNLSPNKQQVFREAYRVLRPRGRLAISDVVLTADLPDAVHADPESVASCVAGASPISDLEQMLSNAGFEGIRIESDEESEEFIREWDAERDVSEYVVSAEIEAVKPD